MFRLQVKTHIDAAHFIADYEGKCNRMHGHRWEVEVVLKGDTLDSRNMLVDFAEIKEILKDYLNKKYDHYVLNETLHEANVTAEWLARRIFEDMINHLPPSVTLARITVWESPECCVKYYGGNDEDHRNLR